ncbi:lysozyme inhibitor LprI family protein [Chitinophaga barathri]|uniref:DUF1311 domain-containing protein n=1 Tax=Chitinophaga barathri TaxID=1647451 RepID=A0A3N4MFW1_9BACT|nr:lysozyme inhibitor LprI family protein [Chitinophaga barathri]RPD40876.1 DUF1311 domain-containing protein [Chitinophaga barathri]
MKILPITVALLILVNICSGQSQSEMNTSSGKDFQKADKELNAIYQKILTDYKADTAFIRNLKISQRMWVQLRELEMNTMFPSKEPGYYGSVLPMCWANYKTMLTYDRIKFLKQWTDGTEEGDVCSGSVKIKS